MKKYWLVKSEPEAYSWNDLVRDKKTSWTGVRNYSARINLRAMHTGDSVLFYHSMTDKSIVGIARVIREAYQDPTTSDEWVAVDIAVEKPLQQPVTLEQVKNTPALARMQLVTRSRLSIQEVSKKEYDIVLRLSQAAR